MNVRVRAIAWIVRYVMTAARDQRNVWMTVHQIRYVLPQVVRIVRRTLIRAEAKNVVLLLTVVDVMWIAGVVCQTKPVWMEVVRTARRILIRVEAKNVESPPTAVGIWWVAGAVRQIRDVWMEVARAASRIVVKRGCAGCFRTVVAGI
jgi:hypothetical protein